MTKKTTQKGYPEVKKVYEQFEEELDRLLGKVQEELDLKRIVLPGMIDKNSARENIFELCHTKQAAEDILKQAEFLKNARKQSLFVPPLSWRDIVQAGYMELFRRQQAFLVGQEGQIKTFDSQHQANFLRSLGVLFQKFLGS